MIRKYNFDYEEGKYILKYSNPYTTEAPFVISADNMQFDTKKFYMYVFKDVKKKLNIEIQNNLQPDIVGLDIVKKGERVFGVIVDLCREITKRINEECFGEICETQQDLEI